MAGEMMPTKDLFTLHSFEAIPGGKIGLLCSQIAPIVPEEIEGSRSVVHLSIGLP